MGILYSNAGAQEKTKKILFIATNIDKLDNQPNGSYLVEVAIPFHEFSEHNHEIDFVSPQGGEVPIYHNGKTSELLALIVQNELYQSKIKNSLKPEQINPKEYSAVFIPGGYGQFWDTHKNKNIQRIIAEIYESGGIIGTVGHGAATLIDVKLKSGAFLVNHKTMTSFPSWNEKNIMKISKFGALLPYDMEVELLKRGADLKVYDHERKKNYEVLDAENRLVTASFANSGKFVAGEIIKFLAKED